MSFTKNFIFPKLYIITMNNVTRIHVIYKDELLFVKIYF
nr:MAG TPA: hypothetical protein [Caudoviricetes sp.]